MYIYWHLTLLQIPNCNLEKYCHIFWHFLWIYFSTDFDHNYIDDISISGLFCVIENTWGLWTVWFMGQRKSLHNHNFYFLLNLEYRNVNACIICNLIWFNTTNMILTLKVYYNFSLGFWVSNKAPFIFGKYIAHEAGWKIIWI